MKMKKIVINNLTEGKIKTSDILLNLGHLSEQEWKQLQGVRYLIKKVYSRKGEKFWMQYYFCFWGQWKDGLESPWPEDRKNVVEISARVIKPSDYEGENNE